MNGLEGVSLDGSTVAVLAEISIEAGGDHGYSYYPNQR